MTNASFDYTFLLKKRNKSCVSGEEIEYEYDGMERAEDRDYEREDRDHKREDGGHEK